MSVNPQKIPPEGIHSSGAGVVAEDENLRNALGSEVKGIMKDGSVLAASHYVNDPSAIGSSQLDHLSAQKLAENGIGEGVGGCQAYSGAGVGLSELAPMGKRKSLGLDAVGSHALSNHLQTQEDSTFLAKKSSHQRSKNISVSSFNNPHLMRGSLNCGYRKHEMIRIN